MKELTFNKSIIPQETSWWCGPASVQVALAIRGISKSERELMLALERLEGNNGWDDRDGTDYIGQVTSVLNSYLGKTVYKTVDTPRDPMTAAQKAVFRKNVVDSIDAGYGVVVNIVSPPGNRPRAQLGSSQPNYGGTWIYHYMTVTGYRIVNGVLYVKIADSGFWPYEYWITFDNLATLITPKGYSYAANVPVSAPKPSEPAPAGSVLDEARSQFVGPGALGQYNGWPQLGGRTLTDAIAVILKKLEDA